MPAAEPIDGFWSRGMLPAALRQDLLTPSRETGKGAPVTTPESGSQQPQARSEESPELERRAAGSVLDDVAIRRALMRIAHEIVEGHEFLQDVYLVAVPNGGVPLGRILAPNLEDLAGVRVPLGLLDTTLYRDDVLVTAERPPLRVTEMPSSVDDRVVLLVEDVVSTGRTIRAAMDGLMDFGRPRAVQVVALVDRGHRELPIRIDFVGKNIPTQPGDSVTLRGCSSEGLEGPLEVVLEREG